MLIWFPSVLYNEKKFKLAVATREWYDKWVDERIGKSMFLDESQSDIKQSSGKPKVILIGINFQSFPLAYVE